MIFSMVSRERNDIMSKMTVFKICPDLYRPDKDSLVAVDSKHMELYCVTGRLAGKPISYVQKEDVKSLADFERIDVDDYVLRGVYGKIDVWNDLLFSYIGTHEKDIVETWTVDFGKYDKKYHLAKKQDLNVSISMKDFEGRRIYGLYNLNPPSADFVRMYKVTEYNEMSISETGDTVYFGTDLDEALKCIAEAGDGCYRSAIEKDVSNFTLNKIDGDEKKLRETFDTLPAVSNLRMEKWSCEANRIINSNFEDILDYIIHATNRRDLADVFRAIGFNNLSKEIYRCFDEKFFTNFDFKTDIKQNRSAYIKSYFNTRNSDLYKIDDNALSDDRNVRDISLKLVCSSIDKLLREKYRAENPKS